jgi:TRAP-type C4-dicarboxylate transport system permease small subunit
MSAVQSPAAEEARAAAIAAPVAPPGPGIAGPAGAFTRLCAFLSKAALVLAIIGLIALILCVQYQVVGRYLLNDTPTWAEALALLLVSYVTALGVAVGVRDAGHIGLESIISLLPEAWRLKLEVLIHALVALFGGLMLHSGWLWTTLKWSEHKPMLPVPEGMDYVPLVIAGALIVLFSIEHIVALLRGSVVEPAWH